MESSDSAALRSPGSGEFEWAVAVDFLLLTYRLLTDTNSRICIGPCQMLIWIIRLWIRKALGRQWLLWFRCHLQINRKFFNTKNQSQVPAEMANCLNCNGQHAATALLVVTRWHPSDQVLPTQFSFGSRSTSAFSVAENYQL